MSEYFNINPLRVVTNIPQSLLFKTSCILPTALYSVYVIGIHSDYFSPKLQALNLHYKETCILTPEVDILVSPSVLASVHCTDM